MTTTGTEARARREPSIGGAVIAVSSFSIAMVCAAILLLGAAGRVAALPADTSPAQVVSASVSLVPDASH